MTGDGNGTVPLQATRILTSKIAIFAVLPADALERIQIVVRGDTTNPVNPSSSILMTPTTCSLSPPAKFALPSTPQAEGVVSLRDLGAGEVFGEYPAIDGGPRSASVVARTRCTVASMPAGAFQELLATEPKVAQALLPQLVTKIRALTTRVYEFSTLAVKNRIQAELLRLANLASREGKSARIVPAPTHVEIASRVSTHREAVTRELNRLCKIGIAERQGSALLVKDIERLAEMVHEATGE